MSYFTKAQSQEFKFFTFLVHEEAKIRISTKRSCRETRYFALARQLKVQITKVHIHSKENFIAALWWRDKTPCSPGFFTSRWHYWKCSHALKDSLTVRRTHGASRWYFMLHALLQTCTAACDEHAFHCIDTDKRGNLNTRSPSKAAARNVILKLVCWAYLFIYFIVLYKALNHNNIWSAGVTHRLNMSCNHTVC